MSILDNLNSLSKKAQGYADIAVDKAKDLAEVAADKAKTATNTAKLNMAILSEQRELEKNYRAIGEWYVSALEGDAPEAVADIVAAIKDSQDKLAAYEAAKAEAAAAKAEAAAAKKAKEPVIEVTIEKKTDAAEPVAEENDCAPCEEAPAQEEPAADEEPKEN